MRTLYDPELFHVVLFDQRGAGRSLPAGELHANHLDALVADIERLRVHLGIQRWLVSGGSWGATLALVYAATCPQAVSGVLVRSVFLAGQRDLDWFFQGAAALLPEAWETLAAQVAPAERGQLLLGLQKILDNAAPALARQAAAAWARYEQCLAQPAQPPQANPELDDPATQDRLVGKYRLQAHYLAQQCFLGEPRLFELIARLPRVPVAIVHGRLDGVCLPQNAWRVHRAIPGSRLAWANGAGHEPFHPAMAAAWIGFLRCFAERGDFAAAASDRV
jgi:proline iminopeptidase